MVPDRLVDLIKHFVNKKPQFNCVQQNDQVSQILLEAGFSEYSHFNCFAYSLKDYYPDCVLLSAHIFNNSVEKGE